MAIKIAKSKTKVVTAAVVEAPLLSGFSEKIDEIGAMEQEIKDIEAAIQAANKEHYDRIDVLNKKLKTIRPDVVTALRELHEDDPADKTFVELGTTFQAELGKAENKRSFKPEVEAVLEEGGPTITMHSMRAIHLMLGDDVFYPMASVKLGDLDQYLTKEQRDEVLNYEHGDRKVVFDKRV